MLLETAGCEALGSGMACSSQKGWAPEKLSSLQQEWLLCELSLVVSHFQLCKRAQPAACAGDVCHRFLSH